MNKFKLLPAFVLVTLASQVFSGEVNIVAADFRSTGESRWSVSVTLKHDDTGWEHYANNWQVVDEAGNVLGERVLHHPHVNEQPFTRSLSGIHIPENLLLVYIEAHDKKHGWSKQHLAVDLTRVKQGRLKVVAK